MAMVFVARQDLTSAEDLARTGAGEQDRQAESGNRFPAIGFHWLLGAIASARGDVGAALDAFDRELAQADRRQLYGPEYGALSLVGRGHALLAIDRAADALEAFRRAGDYIAGYPRAILGAALAEARRDGRAMPPADRARDRNGRSRSPGSMFTACEAALLGDADAAIHALERSLADPTPTFLGWAIPLEPAFFGLRQDARFARVLDALAARAT
jgi:tetratricopeptide (TPR) repeat protein